MNHKVGDKWRCFLLKELPNDGLEDVQGLSVSSLRSCDIQVQDIRDNAIILFKLAHPLRPLYLRWQRMNVALPERIRVGGRK